MIEINLVVTLTRNEECAVPSYETSFRLDSPNSFTYFG